MGTTAQKLQAILDSKADIAAALEEKHAVVPETFAEYGNAIRTISQNDAPNIRNPVKFVDYDGTLLYSYGVQAALALEELPELPTRPGLTNQGWNYTLAQLKTQVQTIGKAIVGCNYITTDGRTRFHITIPNSTFSLFKIGLAQTKTKTLVIDWGDGTVEGEFGSTTYTIRSHQYSPSSYPASYVIEVYGINGGLPNLAGAIVGSAGSSTTSNPSSNSATTQVTALGCMFDEIEVGEVAPTLGTNTFRWITSVRTINLPRCITTLGQQCLGGLDAAKGLVIPSSVTTVNNSIFAYCYATEMISLPPTITAFTNTMFQSCYAWMELVVPYSITSIGTQCFMNCGAMQDLKFPAAVTTIPSQAFQGCAAMPHAEFLGTVASIGASALNGCNSLKEFTVGSGTTAIQSSTFSGCNAIQRITFLGDIASIATKAFNNCYGCRVFDFRNNTQVPTLVSDAFTNTPSSKKIVVPDSLYTSWSGADVWSNYQSSIVKASESGL